MSDLQLQATARDFLKAMSRRNKKRRQVLVVVPAMIGLSGFVAATLPVGKPDFVALAIAGALAWGAHFVLSPMRRRSAERFFELEATRFKQLVAAKGLSLPGAMERLLKAGDHKALARQLVAALPGGLDLLEETADGAIWFGSPKTGSPAKPSAFETLSQFAAGHGMSPAAQSLLETSSASAAGANANAEIVEKLKARADAQMTTRDTKSREEPAFIPLQPLEAEDDEGTATASGR